MQRLSKLFLPALLALAFVTLLNGNGRMGLCEPSEARYAEVAREMLETGDFVSPQIDYVYHFTKPPLTYWITDAGYALFGVGPLGARFFLAVAAVAVLTLTSRLYALQFPGSTGAGAAAVLFFSVEFFAMGKVLTSDLYLTLWTTAGFYLWAMNERARIGPRLFSVLFGAAAACALLTKGGIGLLVWASALVPYAVWKDKGRSLRPIASPWCWLTFLALASPWFVAAGLVHPGLLRYLALRESFEAAYSSGRYHPGPLYYYLPVLAAGLLPWWLLVAAKWRQAVRPGFRLWLIWAIVPPLLWSCFAAKLPTYILPSFPAWALLAAAAALEGEAPSRWALAAAAALVAGACSVGLWALGSGAWDLPPVGGAVLALFAAATLLALLGLVPAWRSSPRGCLACLMGAVLAVQIAAPALFATLGERVRIPSGLERLLAEDRLKEEAVLEYRVTLFSVPFCIRDKVAAYDNGFAKNKYAEGTPPHILGSPEALAAYVRANPKLWVVTDRNGEKSLKAAIPGLALLLRDGGHSVWGSAPVAARIGGAGAGHRHNASGAAGEGRFT